MVTMAGANHTQKKEDERKKRSRTHHALRLCGEQNGPSRLILSGYAIQDVWYVKKLAMYR